MYARNRHKFNAKITVRNGIKFASMKEARYYDSLKVLQSAGEVVFFLRQVPFDLPGRVKYFVDFQVFYSRGDVEFVDVKGRDTPMSKMKRKQVEDLYPVEILLR